jgi:hypothetical protein
MMIGWAGNVRAALLACLCAFATTAESGGTITGTVDKEPVTWTLRASQSDWSDYGVNVMGRYTEGATEFPSIMIGFEKDGNKLHRPEVRLFSQAQPNGYRGDEDDGVAVNVTRWEVHGNTLLLTGAISGSVLFVIDPVGAVVDQKNGLDLDLIFDLTITNP